MADAVPTPGTELDAEDGVAVGDVVRVLEPFDTAFPEPLQVDRIFVAEDGGVVFELAGGHCFARHYLEVAE